MKLSKVGMMANTSPGAIDLALESVRYLDGKLDEMFLEEHILEKARSRADVPSCPHLDPAGQNLDLILVFGGDGTILRAVRCFDNVEIPLCGVNLGRMGFLSQVEPKDLWLSLDLLLKGDFGLSPRMKLDAHLGGEKLGSPLNELLVQGGGIGKIFRANLMIGDLGDLSLEGDGVIISTPTGSTGHSLSGGGAVMVPEMEGILVVPLGALTPSCPLVVPADTILAVNPGDECSLALDGEVVAEAGPGVEIRIAKSDSKVRFVTFDSGLLWRKLRQRIGG
jgi:NAD+ kinase